MLLGSQASHQLQQLSISATYLGSFVVRSTVDVGHDPNGISLLEVRFYDTISCTVVITHA